MERSALPGQGGPAPNDAPALARCFWARPSFGARPVPPGTALLVLRWLVPFAVLAFVVTGETTGASHWHIGIVAVVLGIDVLIPTILLVRARPSPDRILRAWALVIPADILTISLAASLDHRNPSVIPTIALASIFNASVMFRSRDTVALGLLAAAGVIAAVIPRHGLGGVDVETFLQAVVTLVVTGFAVSRSRTEEGLRRTLMAAERREREQNDALRESEASFRTLFDSATDGIFLLSPDSELMSVNESFASMHGYRVDEMRAFSLKDLDTPASALLAPERIRRLVAGEALTFEVEHYHRDGHVFPLEVSGSLVSFDGKPLIQCAHRDITARRQAEEALHESEARFHALFDRASDGIILTSSDFGTVAVNESFARMHGYSVEDMRTVRLQDLDTPASALLAPERAARLLAGESLTFEVEHYHRDGHAFPLEVSASLISVGGQSLIQSFHRDITDRKLAEEAIRESEARFRAVADTVPVAIRIYDGDRMVFANEANSALTGYSHDEILAPGFLQGIVHPEDLPSLALREERRFAHEPNEPHYMSRIVRKDGQVRWVVSDTVPITFDGRPATLVTSSDITERRQAEEERRKLDLQVQDAQRLESLGVLAGGIAHDFNNLLTVVLGNASLALMQMSAESPARESIESIGIAAQRAADLTAQMLAYSGRGSLLVEPLHLAHLVEEMAPLLGIVVSPQAILEYHFDPNTPLAYADSAQIRQVVMSLITNASEAIGDAGGFIAISTGTLTADRAYLSETYLDNDLPEGDYAFLEVADTGSGIYEETRLRIFEPFFTTKFTGRGLGLAAVLGIVRGHRGAIKVASEVGRGTTFTVLFPLADSFATEPAYAPPPQALEFGSPPASA